MNKYKELLGNIGLLTISNLGSKILSFLLVPLYTSYLSTGDYGIFDNYTTAISLVAPILTLCIANGVMRFCLDEELDNSEIFSIGLFREIKAILVFSLLVFVNFKFSFIPILNEQPIFLILLYVSSRGYIFLTLFCRGINRVYELAIAGGLNSIAVLLFNILFLKEFKLGLEGYFLANILSYLIPCIYIIVKTKAHRFIKIRTSRELKVRLKKYITPMIFSELGWWVNNASDRFIVTLICGISANGIYSIAYKLPSILNVFQNIFNQAWTLSAVKENGKDRGKFYSEIYAIYNCGMVFSCSFFLIFDKILARILFSNDFYAAWKYAPFLMISSVFGALIGLLEGIFIAEKNSKVIAITTCMGAIINTVLNFLLVYLIGPLGAAISTLVAYVIVWGLRLYLVKKVVDLDIKILRDTIVYLLLVFQSYVLLNVNTSYLYLIHMVIFIIILLLNRNELLKIKVLVLIKIKNKLM